MGQLPCTSPHKGPWCQYSSRDTHRETCGRMVFTTACLWVPYLSKNSEQDHGAAALSLEPWVKERLNKAAPPKSKVKGSPSPFISYSLRALSHLVHACLLGSPLSSSVLCIACASKGALKHRALGAPTFPRLVPPDLVEP